MNEWFLIVVSKRSVLGMLPGVCLGTTWIIVLVVFLNITSVLSGIPPFRLHSLVDGQGTCSCESTIFRNFRENV